MGACSQHRVSKSFPPIQLACVLLTLQASLVSGYSFHLQRNADECFSQLVTEEEASSEMYVRGDFSLSFTTRGPPPQEGISVMLKGPQGNELYSSIQPTGEFEIRVSQAGLYTLCFDNNSGSRTLSNLLVSFDFEDTGKDGLQSGKTISSGEGDKGGVAQPEDVNDLYKDIRKVARAIDLLRSDQHHVKTRMNRHRDTVESTFTRVVRYSILESFVLIGMATVQLMYVRNLFDKKRFGHSV